MNYKVFEKIITSLQQVEEKVDKLYKLDVDLTSITNDYNNIITHLLRVHYGEIGEDYISWWLYEDVEKVLYKENSEEIDRELKTIKQLWKYVEELRKSDDFKEYEFPKEMTDEERQQILDEMSKKMFE